MYRKTQFTIIIALLSHCHASVRFTNLKCELHRPEFAVIQMCRLKLIKRSTAALNIHAKLLQIPVVNATINLSLHKKLNGYRPFLYNTTVDFCKFMRFRKQNPFVNLILDIILKDSNINHTCPYNDAIIVKNLILHEDMFRNFPLPRGEYMFNLKVAAFNDWKADIKTYIETNFAFAD